MSTLDAAFKYDQAIKKKFTQLESENKNLETQIEFLTYRQDKIYNMLPLRIIRKIKSSFLSSIIMVKFLFKKAKERGLILLKYFKTFCFKHLNIPIKLFYKIFILFCGKRNLNYLLLFFDRLFNSQDAKEFNKYSSRNFSSQYDTFLKNHFVSSKRAKHINSLIIRKKRINKGKSK